MFSNKSYKRHQLVNEICDLKSQLSDNGLRILNLHYTIRNSRFSSFNMNELMLILSHIKRLIRNRV